MKVRPHKFVFDHSAGIAELVGVFSVPSQLSVDSNCLEKCLRNLILATGNVMLLKWQKYLRLLVSLPSFHVQN